MSGRRRYAASCRSLRGPLSAFDGGAAEVQSDRFRALAKPAAHGE
ncbi:hypothetical protein AB0N09_19995 [Streptomyces erythrochromogenes]